MKKTTPLLRIAAIALVLMLCLCVFAPVNAAAVENHTANQYPAIPEENIIVNKESASVTIELPAKWSLVIDASGSMDDEFYDQMTEALNKWFHDVTFTFQASFDTELHPNEPDYRSKRDTDIVGAVDETVEVFGQERIVVVTDGVQDPADYSSLTEKSNIDLHLILLGDNREAQDELIDAFEAKMAKSTNCSLTAYYGTSFSLPVLDQYQPETVTVGFDELQKTLMALQSQYEALQQDMESASTTTEQAFQDIQAEMEQMTDINGELTDIDNELDEHDRLLYYLDRVNEANSLNFEAVLAAELQNNGFLMFSVWGLIIAGGISVLMMMYNLIEILKVYVMCRYSNTTKSQEPAEEQS